MRKFLLLAGLLALLLTFAACGAKAGDVLENPDITIDQIGWSVEEADADGDKYLLCTFTNNSAYNVTSLRLSFTGREDLTEEALDSFYAAVQAGQGFGDGFMENFRKERQKNDLSISMYAQMDGQLAAGATAQSVKCYYFGGFTSKNIIYPELFIPENAQFTYEKKGKLYSIGYDFATGEYTVAQLQGD